MSSPRPAAAEAGCFPPCREGYLCQPSTGECVSACNPPCAIGETCTPDARCVASAPTSAAPAIVVVTPVVAMPEPTTLAHPSVAFLLRAGPTFGWLQGGSLSMGAAIRLADSYLLDLELGGAGGVGGGSTYARGTGEASLRYSAPRRITFMGRVGFGAGFMAEYETHSGDGYDYSYRLLYARLAAGILAKHYGRRAVGLEASFALGSAAQTSNYVDTTDYGGFYGELALNGVFTF